MEHATVFSTIHFCTAKQTLHASWAHFFWQEGATHFFLFCPLTRFEEFRPHSNTDSCLQQGKVTIVEEENRFKKVNQQNSSAFFFFQLLVIHSFISSTSSKQLLTRYEFRENTKESLQKQEPEVLPSFHFSFCINATTTSEPLQNLSVED